MVFSSSELTNGETYTVTSTEVTAGEDTEGTGPMGGGMPGGTGSSDTAGAQ